MSYTNDLSGFGFSGIGIPNNANMVLGTPAGNLGISSSDLAGYSIAPFSNTTGYTSAGYAQAPLPTQKPAAQTNQTPSSSGFNWDNAGSIMQGIAGFGMALAALKANKIAQQSLRAQTAIANANLANSTSEYNTALEDRARARYAYMGQADQADSYINNNRLETRTI